MISVEEALQKIKKNTRLVEKKEVLLAQSLGSVLASDIKSTIDLPVGNNSAMDGFVLHARDVQKVCSGQEVRLKISGDIKAGDKKQRSLKVGQTYRIMTGAFIPKHGGAVLAKEDAEIMGGCLYLKSPLVIGKHIRKKGEEIRKGEIVLKKGTVIGPGTIGFLATLGKAKVSVYRMPKVTVLTTGSELVKPGKRLRYGQIYESNSWMVKAALESMNMAPLKVQTVKDNPNLLRRAITKAIKQSDALILTGGVSVGDYDYVKAILKEEGVRQVFWRVKQKPGKPLYVGKKGKALIFGLPGNPASVFTCFYKYVYPALRMMAGFSRPELECEDLAVSKEIRTDAKRTLLLKSRVMEENGKKTVRALRRQGSHMLSSLCESNAFVVLSPSTKPVRKGNRVRVDLLPYQGG